MIGTVFLFIGTPEVVVILFVVLLLFGSKRIPEFARGLGKGIRQFKDATQDIQNDIQESARKIERDTNINQPKDDK